ncbi:MAG: TRAP transporter large permease subunit, partial [Kangiellaceae bacterium]|nr:TRAP transporter large permease subunit [Kangiellaceae bacterium]
MEILALLMFVAVCAVLLMGYPVAFSLAGTALVFGFIGVATGDIPAALLKSAFSRLYGIMQNPTLIAVPLFVFMGVML